MRETEDSQDRRAGNFVLIPKVEDLGNATVGTTLPPGNPSHFTPKKNLLTHTNPSCSEKLGQGERQAGDKRSTRHTVRSKADQFHVPAVFS